MAPKYADKRLESALFVHYYHRLIDGFRGAGFHMRFSKQISSTDIYDDSFNAEGAGGCMALRKTMSSGVGLVTATSNGEVGNAIDRHLNDLRQRVSQRAFELCAERGWTHGHDLADWLRAESELMAAAPIEVSETEDEYSVKVEVPGFKERDLEIFCEPNRVLVIGNAQSQTQGNDNNGRVLYSERQSSEVFRLVNLENKIDPERCEAVVRDGILDLQLAKSQASKPTRVQVKAA